ncbi:hypothetical protein IPG41_04480 [Candidatus Peregrinibacteria bacterium]|nr:MAG: hypothetical protein IPG41_04480 [Candidatus Peregrinibacteria bacterium]
MVRPYSKWKLAVKTLPFVLVVLVLKMLVHHYDQEMLTLSSLFTAIVSANIFLIGFLISGTLVDYKESEKIPSDLASSLQSLADEGFILNKAHKQQIASPFLKKILMLNQSVIDWFHKKESYETVQDQLFTLNDDFLAFEKETPANFIVRLKQEQNQLRKTLGRAKVIRETSFLGTGYAVAEILTFILVLALIFIRMDPFYESLFFAAFISFMLIYMIFFIKDLDNPFGYGKSGVIEEVSLRPLLEGHKRLELNIEKNLHA